MTNAVKFTDEGSITLGYKCCTEGLYFYVKDTGSGIPEDKVNHIFERFVRVEQNKKGTGLGLAICEMIIRKLGGRLVWNLNMVRDLHSGLHFRSMVVRLRNRAQRLMARLTYKKI